MMRKKWFIGTNKEFSTLEGKLEYVEQKDSLGFMSDDFPLESGMALTRKVGMSQINDYPLGIYPNVVSTEDLKQKECDKKSCLMGVFGSKSNIFYEPHFGEINPYKNFKDILGVPKRRKVEIDMNEIEKGVDIKAKYVGPKMFGLCDEDKKFMYETALCKDFNKCKIWNFLAERVFELENQVRRLQRRLIQKEIDLENLRMELCELK